MPDINQRKNLLWAQSDFSGGVGHAVWDGRTNGVLHGIPFVLLKDEARMPIGPTSITMTGSAGGVMAWQYFFSEPIITAGTYPDDINIYAIGNDSTNRGWRGKISGQNANYGTKLYETESASAASAYGQPVRYQGQWILPEGHATTAGTGTLWRMTASDGNTSDDTWGSGYGTTAHGPLGLLNHQLVGYINQTGYHILKSGSAALTSGNWGQAFEVGDIKDNALAVAGLRGLSFVLNKRGLYSFNSGARASQIFSGFETFKWPFNRGTLTQAFNGLIFTTTAGIFYYEPGNVPISIGPWRDFGTGPAAFAGNATQVNGIFHDVAVCGENLYAVYQLTIGSASHFIYWGAPSRPGDPTSLVWSCIGSYTTEAPALYHGIEVIADTFPDSTSNTRPVLFTNGATNKIDYYQLDWTGRPVPRRMGGGTASFNSVAAGILYLSEIPFPSGMNVEEIVITCEDVLASDGLTVNVAINDETSTHAGVAGAVKNGRNVYRLNGLRGVYRLFINLNVTQSTTTQRHGLAIKRIEVFGTEG